MDLIQLQKVLQIKKSKMHKLLDNFLLYTITLVICSVFCSSPFWFPSLLSSTKLLVFVYIPKISSFLRNPKLIFIVGNLIIVLLLGESKFFALNSLRAPSNVYYNEFIERKRGVLSSAKEKPEVTIKENVMQSFEGIKVEEEVWEEEGKIEMVKEGGDLQGEDGLSLPPEELNKRADDFIARVNRQRIQEARLLH